MALLMTLLATVTPCSQLLLREESPQESPVPTGLRGCSVPALVHDDSGVMLTAWLRWPNCSFHMPAVDGPAGTAMNTLHLPRSTGLFGGPILHPVQHRLLSLDNYASTGGSCQVPWCLAVAPRVSATWDHHLSSSVALSRLWVGTKGK